MNAKAIVTSRFVKQILSVFILSLWGIFLQAQQVTIIQEGTSACKGTVVRYTCSIPGGFNLNPHFIVPADAGTIVGRGRTAKGNVVKYWANVRWNENFSGAGSTVKFSYRKFPFLSAPVTCTLLVTFPIAMQIDANAGIVGNNCVDFNTSSTFTFVRDQPDNIGNIAWYIDDKLYNNGASLNTANILFNDPIKSSSTLRVEVSDLCGNTNDISYEKTVNIGPAPITSVKGSRLVCNGFATKYEVQGASNASSFNWTCDGAVISPIESSPTQREVRIMFPTAATYHVTVTPVNSACGAATALAKSFDVTVEQSQDKITEAIYDQSELTSKLSKILRTNTCSERCSDCPVSLSKLKLFAKLDLGDEYNLGNNAFEATVVVQFKLTRTSGSPQLLDPVTLTINQGEPVKLFAKDITDDLSGLRQIDVIIKSYKPDAKAGSIRLRTYYTEENETDVSGVKLNMLPPATDNNELTFAWAVDNTCTFSPNYQLQVLRLYDLSNSTLASNPDWEEWRNAMNLYTESGALQYKLLLAEGTGTYVCRARAIGNYSGQTMEKGSSGEWSAVMDFDYTQPEEGQNWIYSRTFTEGNKLSEKMQYANGLGNVSQQQVRLHDNNQIVASQTVQDYSGRDALKSLPIPVSNQTQFGYVSNLLMNGITAFSADNFDTGDKLIAPDAASDANGYYSGTDNGINAGVANAQGVPYSRTVFSNDASGKVREQASPGLTMSTDAINGGKTVKTFYTSASEDELIRLFGSESPKASDVHKVITIDPNGTASITYIDKNGKTIATALSVGKSDALDVLPSQDGANKQYTETITEKMPFGQFGSSSSKPLIFTTPTTVTVDYKLTPKVIQDLCASACKTCDYNVEFWLHDKDLETSKKVNEITIPAGSCSSVAAAQLPSFTMSLEAGRNYVFEKRVVSHTQDGTGKLYLDDQISAVRQYYSDLLGTGDNAPVNVLLNTIESYLKTNSIKDLYKYLDDNGYKHELNSNGQDNYKLTIDCSLDLYIPYLPDDCPEYVYTRGCFLEYFKSTYKDTHPEYYATVGDRLHFAVDYTEDQFNTLMDNLVSEKVGTEAKYPFPALWDTWMQQVKLYGVMQYMQADQNSEDPSGTVVKDMLTYTNDETGEVKKVPEFNLLQSFFKAYHVPGSLDIGDVGIEKEDFVTELGTTDGLLYAYKYFFYDPNNQNNYQCMHSGCNWTVPLPDITQLSPLCSTSLGDIPIAELHTRFVALPKPNHQQIASCILNSNQYNEIIPDAVSDITNVRWINAVTSLNRRCTNACDHRADEFQNAIIDKIHDGNEYVETDKNELELVPAAAISYRPWGDKITPAVFVKTCEITRLTQAVVNHCKTYCNVHIVPQPGNINKILRIGSAEEIEKIKMAMTGTFDIQVHQMGSCGVGYDNIEVHNDGTVSLGDNLIPDLTSSNFELYGGSMLNGINWFKTSWHPNSDLAAPITINEWAGGTEGEGYGITLKKSLEPNKQYQLSLEYAQANGIDDFIVKATTEKPAYTIFGNSYDRSFDQVIINNVTKDNVVSTGPLYNDPYIFKNLSVDFSPTAQSKYLLVYPYKPSGSMQNTGNVLTQNLKLNELTIVSTCPTTHSLCFKWIGIPTSVPLVSEFGDPSTSEFFNHWEPKPCAKVTADKIIQSLKSQKQDIIATKVAAYNTDYSNLCQSAENLNDELSLSYELGYHHYTLYYYDRAGNLMRTVPPAGVDQAFLSKSLATIKAEIDAASKLVPAQEVVPSHNLVTWYQYNSQGQMVKQHTPDANNVDVTKDNYYTDFIYDSKGRLRFSRSAKQKALNTYSYTKYDELSRIIEVGESTYSTDQLTTQKDVMDFPSSGYEKTVTKYSLPSSESSDPADQLLLKQRYVRNRVSYTYTDEDGASSVTDRTYTWYSYDTHGNVEWTVTDIPGLGKKQIRYEYDLLSNKVTKVAYNEGQPDQFFHKYDYDTDNRIKAAYTSTDGMLWDCDARYEYYAQGPLKRSVIGDDQVQGIDYTYTINGWLKGINHPSLSAFNDPGADGATGKTSGVDAFGMALTYYKGDYVNASGKFGTSDGFNPVPGQNASTGHDRNLYNGNISAWATNTATNVGMAYEGLTAEQYAYDDLNRIKSSTFTTKTGSGWQPVSNNDFGTSYEYDPNGNLKNLNRNAHSLEGKNPLMDRLVYNYYPGTNKLKYITDDPKADGYWPNDVDNQLVNESDPSDYNYKYDENGNLIEDKQGKISKIDWTVYGKIKRVTKTDGTILSFTYDASGKRISKAVEKTDGTKTTTYYVPDAQGNIMAIYNKDKQPVTNGYVETLFVTEQPIYGSDRLGTHNERITLSKVTVTNGETVAEELGVKQSGGQGNWVLPIVSATNAGQVDALMKQSAPSILGQTNALGQGNILQAAVAEDGSGELQFSFVGLDQLNGKTDVAVVLDKNGNLMYGQAGVARIAPFAQANGKSAIVRDQSDENIYYIYTIGTNAKMFRHTVNMAAPGNGTVDAPLGEVTATNEILVSASDFVPTMALATIHTATTTKNLLYLLRSTTNTPANLSLEAYDVSGTTPAKTVLASLTGNTASAGIHLSPNGQYLAVSVDKGLQTGFFDFTSQGSDILVYSVGSDNQMVTLVNTINTGANTNALSFDFSPDSKYVYYTSTSAGSGYQLNRIALNGASAQTITSVGKPAAIALAPNNKLYVAVSGNTTITEVIHNATDVPGLRDVSLNLAVGYQLTGALPLQPHTVLPAGGDPNYFTRRLGFKSYELKDHLGNVRAVFSDRKLSDLVNGQPANFRCDLLAANNYYPFGMEMPKRNYNSPDYRYGFNGKEKDDEVNGNGVTYDYGFRIYDARIAKFLSVDPLTKSYAMLTPYQFASNTPIWATDLDGKEADFRSSMEIANAFLPKQKQLTVNKIKEISEANINGSVHGVLVSGTILIDAFLTKGTLTLSLLGTRAAEETYKDQNGGKEPPFPIIISPIPTPTSVYKGVGKGVLTLEAQVAMQEEESVVMIKLKDLKYSQTTAGGGGRADKMRLRIEQNGYNEDPIDVVQTSEGFTTLDHTRPAVALEYGMEEIPGIIHQPNELLPERILKKNSFGESKTWGEALTYRASNQKPTIPSTGTTKVPRLPKRKN